MCAPLSSPALLCAPVHTPYALLSAMATINPHLLMHTYRARSDLLHLSLGDAMPRAQEFSNPTRNIGTKLVAIAQAAALRRGVRASTLRAASLRHHSVRCVVVPLPACIKCLSDKCSTLCFCFARTSLRGLRAPFANDQRNAWQAHSPTTSRTRVP